MEPQNEFGNDELREELIEVRKAMADTEKELHLKVQAPSLKIKVTTSFLCIRIAKLKNCGRNLLNMK